MRAPLRLAVFCGPSLPHADRLAVDGVTYLPPASRGDVIAAAHEYDAVLLIDGVFHHDLAPSPKECFEATRVARMYGAASMGALRAAECRPYGFKTLGAIALWYANGTIDGDDEVAVLTHPITQAAVTVPSVNARYVAWLGYRRGIFTRHEADEYIAKVRGIFYMDRSLDDLCEAAPLSVRAAIERIVRYEGDLKNLDARFALRSVFRSLRGAKSGHLEVVPPPLPAVRADANRDSAPLSLPQSCPVFPGTFDRAIPFAQTVALLPRLCERYQVTRVGDTTLLDLTGIPTTTAIVPHSPDMLGVYNGKGLTREAATVSAVMEAVERQIGADIPLRRFKERMSMVGERLDLDACGILPEAMESMIDCVLGTDLISGDALPVPIGLVQCPWFGGKIAEIASTNGLASGNNLTEAIYHALCELVERHAWSMYEVRSSLVPRYFGGADATEICTAAEFVVPTGDATVDALIASMHESGLSVRALLLDESPLPYTVMVTVTEPGADPPMAHTGLGCALSPTHALTRALTEAVQSRVVDIQAAREDILRADEYVDWAGKHSQRIATLPYGKWYFDVPGPSVQLAQLENRATGDLASDVRSILRALVSIGIERVVIVDLSPTDLPIAVVRALVPGLEQSMITGRLGRRARALLNPFSLAR